MHKLILHHIKHESNQPPLVTSLSNKLFRVQGASFKLEVRKSEAQSSGCAGCTKLGWRWFRGRQHPLWHYCALLRAGSTSALHSHQQSNFPALQNTKLIPCGHTDPGICLRACSLTYPPSNALPYCLWPLWLHQAFQYCLINARFSKNVAEHKMCVFIFSTNFV